MLVRIKELFFTVIGLTEALIEEVFTCAVILIMCAIEVIALILMLPFGLLEGIYKFGKVCYYKLKGANKD